MTPITRRTLITHGAAAAAITFAGGALTSASAAASLNATMPPQAAAGLFVFDARFARSLAMAQSHLAAGAALLDPRETDLGIAWRGTIPALLDQGQRIGGLTLWSDRMISEIFAREAGRSLSSVELSAGDSAATLLQHWWLD